MKPGARPLLVRRVPDLNPEADRPDTLFDLWHFHAFFTEDDREVTDTATADRTHRRHTILERIHARPEELRPGPVAVRGVHREPGGLAGVCGPGGQPHPRRRDNHRR